MAKRHKDALLITQGACNPSGIAVSIFEACREIRAEPDYKGTISITNDPAIRLMVHQLSFITRAWALDDIGNYQTASAACEEEEKS